MARDLSNILSRRHDLKKIIQEKKIIKKIINAHSVRAHSSSAIDSNEGDVVNVNFLDYSQFDSWYRAGELGERIAKEYRVPIEDVDKLAEDPDHGGKKTISGYIESMVALELERDGILGITIDRGPKMTDLKDGWGRKWDVKAPPKIENRGFDLDAAVNSVKKKFGFFPDGDIGIFLCVSFMDLESYLTLQEELEKILTENELLRIRQVEIRGLEGCNQFVSSFLSMVSKFKNNAPKSDLV